MQPMADNTRIVVAPQPLTAPGLHQRALEIIDVWQRGSILDAGAGEGALSAELAKLGFAVTAADKDPTRFRVPDVTIVPADLNERLPFAPSSFEAVVCLEVLEHVENPFQLLREFARVLVPGGTLLLSTPNILNIRSRMGFLLRGFHSNFSPLVMGLDQNRSHFPYPMHPFDRHINPRSLLEIMFMMDSAGLRLEQVFCREKHMPRALLVLTRAVLRASAFASNRWGWNWHYIDASLQAWLLRDEVLWGSTLIVKAQRADPGTLPVKAVP